MGAIKGNVTVVKEQYKDLKVNQKVIVIRHRSSGGAVVETTTGKVYYLRVEHFKRLPDSWVEVELDSLNPVVRLGEGVQGKVILVQDAQRNKKYCLKIYTGKDP